MDDLLERYEAYGDEGVYVEARRQYEQALGAGRDDARLLTNFGYLQECHGRLSIRAAVECYERAIEADPQYDKPHWQLVFALSGLGQADQAVARYRQRLAEAPAELRWYKFLASAYKYARDYEHAAQIIRAGLDLSPGDASLTEQEGDVLAATGHPDEALDRWRRAFAADPENLSSRYSSAFLLEKQGRLAEAVAEWRFIVSWCEDHGYASTADWPRRELQRLEADDHQEISIDPSQRGGEGLGRGELLPLCRAGANGSGTISGKRRYSRDGGAVPAGRPPGG